jgi:hypothetical protein
MVEKETDLRGAGFLQVNYVLNYRNLDKDFNGIVIEKTYKTIGKYVRINRYLNGISLKL